MEAEVGLGGGGGRAEARAAQAAAQVEVRRSLHRAALAVVVGCGRSALWRFFVVLGSQRTLPLAARPVRLPLAQRRLWPGFLRRRRAAAPSEGERPGWGRWAAAAGSGRLRLRRRAAAAAAAASRRLRGRRRCRPGRGPGAARLGAVAKKTSRPSAVGVDEFGVIGRSGPEEIRLRQPPVSARSSSPPILCSTLPRSPARLPLIDVLAAVGVARAPAPRSFRRRGGCRRPRGRLPGCRDGGPAGDPGGGPDVVAGCRRRHAAPPAAPRSGCTRRRRAALRRWRAS